jgi:predicted DNA-binding transcriptional regulator AlpA
MITHPIATLSVLRYRETARQLGLLTAKEAGDILGVTGPTVRHWSCAGILPKPVPYGKRHYWKREHIDQYLASFQETVGARVRVRPSPAEPIHVTVPAPVAAPCHQTIRVQPGDTLVLGKRSYVLRVSSRGEAFLEVMH